MHRTVPEGPGAIARDDRILPVTRFVLAAVVPFLALAFLILYFFPERAGRNFAWDIKPPMTALFIGAGYLGGGYQFVRLIAGKKWHCYAMAFPPVSTFTVAMMAATLLHWDRFDIHHFPFQLWLILYVLTPFLVTWLWWNNRRTDPRTPEPGDPLLPPAVNRGFAALGIVTLFGALTVFVDPSWVIDAWAWKLTPLTARVLAGWFALMGVGSLVLARERRWSACRVALQSFMLWHGLVLVGAFWHREDFGVRGLGNAFVAITVAGLLGMGTLYLAMEIQRRRMAVDPAGPGRN